MSQKPSACRFVLFHFFDLGVDEVISRPAVVTSLGSGPEDDQRVNLHVFLEPTDLDRDAEPSFKNGERLDDDGFRSDALPCHADPLRTATAGTWSWPPRV